MVIRCGFSLLYICSICKNNAACELFFNSIYYIKKVLKYLSKHFRKQRNTVDFLCPAASRAPVKECDMSWMNRRILASKYPENKRLFLHQIPWIEAKIEAYYWCERPCLSQSPIFPQGTQAAFISSVTNLETDSSFLFSLRLYDTRSGINPNEIKVFVLGVEGATVFPLKINNMKTPSPEKLFEIL